MSGSAGIFDNAIASASSSCLSSSGSLFLISRRLALRWLARLSGAPSAYIAALAEGQQAGCKEKQERTGSHVSFPSRMLMSASRLIALVRRLSNSHLSMRSCN